jgi:hypothetical protein
MRLKRIEKFSKPLMKGLLQTQRVTLSQVVCGLLGCRCLILAEIARCFETSVAFVHNLKRVFRYGDNERITDQRSKEVVAARMIEHLRCRLKLKPQQPLEVILDWTSVGPYQVLSALMAVRGRAVPVLQGAIAKWELKSSQNQLEQQLLESLRKAVPLSCPVVIVADRGFGRTDLFPFLKEQSLSYVIRVKGDVWIECPGYSGQLNHYALSPGQTFKLKQVGYRKTKPYPVQLALTCVLIEGQVSRWFLATDLPMTAGQVVAIYRRRFWCEESFRDQKQEFALEGVRVQQARRLENLLLALAIVFLLLAVIGLRAEKLGYRDQFAGVKKGQIVISWVQLALHLLRQSSTSLNLLFEARAGSSDFHWV